MTLNEIDNICISTRWKSSLQDVREEVMWGQTIVCWQENSICQTSRTPPCYRKLKRCSNGWEIQAKLRNQFEALEHSQNVEEEWDRMKTCVNETAEEVIGKRRETRKDQWITQDTWKLIDERKEAKCKSDQSVQGNKVNLTNSMQAQTRKWRRAARKTKKPLLRRQKQKKLLRKIIPGRYSKLSKN